MEVKVTVTDTSVRVLSPYNVGFVSGARRMSGKWSSPVWVFHRNDELRVRNLCKQVYGTDGEGVADTVSVRVEFDGSEDGHQEPITVGGRVVARAFGRDSGAKLGDGVVVEKGGFNSGGSVKNWRTEVTGGTVVVIHDFPRGKAESMGLEVVDNQVKINREELMGERERLVRRLEEIDKILEG
jgi:hypothetical protein